MIRKHDLPRRPTVNYLRDRNWNEVADMVSTWPDDVVCKIEMTKRFVRVEGSALRGILYVSTEQWR